MSSTVAKALSLLDHFSEAEPELGLSELARRSSIDKATVHRMLVVLAEAGFVEQRSETKLYRLGTDILRLARIREASFPIATILEPALAALTKVTGETVHASLISGSRLVTIGISESQKANRVSLIAGQVLNFHSTASGLVILAFSQPAFVTRVLEGTLPRLTARTPVDPDAVRKIIERARKDGFVEADQTHEDEVYGIAAPLFDSGADACGAIAVATPIHRVTPAFRRHAISEAIRTSVDITEKIGGVTPNAFRAIAKRLAA